MLRNKQNDIDMNSNKNIPQLRFPEFNGEWEEKKLVNVTNNEDSRRRPVSKTNRKDGDYPYYGANGIQDYIDNYIFDGDYLLVGEDGSVLSSDNTPVINWASGKFWVNNHAHVLSQKGDNSLKYVSYILSTIKIPGLVTGIPPKLNQENLNNILLPIPPRVSEQKKIAECLSAVDDMISAQGEKVDALKEKKKGMMQQMFPQRGETTPRLRFPGFTREWEEKRFSELYEKHNVKNDLSFGVDKIISVANMYYKTDANVGDEDYLKTYNIFRIGDIAFEGNKNANFAFGRFVENTIGDGIVSHVFDVYSPISPNHCIDYWKYAINYERIMRPVLEKSTIKSTMMTNLIGKDFLKQSILVPSPAEQQKIAECLSAMDYMIASESAKLDALKDHKKGLMQQLFPQPNK